MKFLNLLLSVCLITTQAFAQTKVTADILVGNANYRNFITNPSCDTNTNGITLTGSATKARVSQSFGSGIAPWSCQIDGVANADTVIFSGKVLDQYLIGQNCQVSFRYGLRDSASGISAGPVFASAINVDGYQTPEITLTSSASITSLQVFNPVINIPCGGITVGAGGAGAGALGKTAPTLKLRFGTPASSNSRLFITQVFSGEASNIVNAAANSESATYTPTYVNMGTVTNSAMTWRKVGGNVEIYGTFTTGTVVAGVASISLPPGMTTNISTLRGVGQQFNNGTGAAAYYVIADTASTVLNFSLQASANASLAKANGNVSFASSTNYSIYASVPIQGWSASQQAAVPSQTDWGYTDFGNMTIGGTTTAPTKPTTPVPTVDKVAGWRIGDRLWLTYTYAQGATVTGSAAGSGDYLFLIPAATGCTIDTTKATLSSTVGSGQAEGTLVGSSSAGVNGVTGGNGHVTAFSTTQLRFQMRNNSTTYAPIGSGFFALNTASQGFSALVSVPCVGWVTSNRAPTLIGSLTSNAAGAWRIESATVAGAASKITSCSTGACTLYDVSTPGWLTSVTNASAQYTFVWPSTNWSSAPTCFTMGFGNVAHTRSWITAPTTTGGVVISYTPPSTLADDAFSIMCMGPR